VAKKTFSLVGIGELHGLLELGDHTMPVTVILDIPSTAPSPSRVGRSRLGRSNWKIHFSVLSSFEWYRSPRAACALTARDGSPAPS
jgi:hypothetical protein